MKRNIVCLMTTFFLLMLLWGVYPARADSAVVGSGTPASCTEAALDAALAELYPGANAPGGVLSFDCGPNPHTLVVTGEKYLYDGTVVDGGGLITLSGGNSTRIFFVSQQARVELHHIRLIYGNAAGGGAIFAEPNFSGDYTNLLLDDVTLSDNTSTTFGGAIGAQHTALSVTNSHLTDNHANGGGGAISLNGGTLTLIATEIISNTAELGGSTGGGLDVLDATLDIQTSTLRGNQSQWSAGGAIALRNSTGTIATSQIEQNTANTFGGGLYQAANSDLALSQVTFTENTATNGGGITNDSSILSLDGASTLTNNTASSGGGGIYSFNGQVTAQNVELLNNESVVGGGIYNHNGPLFLTDVMVRQNLGTIGGGLYNSGQAILNRVTLAQNTSGDGGAIFNATGMTAILTNVTLSENSANFGGGVFNNGALTLINATVTKNTALGGGGGVLHNSGASTALAMINTLFALNTASASAPNSDQCLLYKAPDSQVFSLWSGLSCGSSIADGNQPNTNAALAPLGFTGTGLSTELTMTHVPLPGSPAEDGGTCGNGAPAIDQRGVARPYGAACDIGAVEMAPFEHTVFLPMIIR